MPTPPKQTLRLFARPLAIAAVVASAGMLSACGDDPAEQAVYNASHMFQSVAAGDENAFMAEALTAYKEIGAEVSPYAGSETGFAEAAAVTLAQSKLGEASYAAQEAARAEAQAMHRVRVLRAGVSEYMVLDAIARAASVYDPAEDLSALEALVDTRAEDAARYAAQQREIDGEIAQHEAKIADFRSRANAERQKAGAIELRMTDVSAQEAANLAAEVREHTLRADQFDFEGDRIAGVVGQLRPTAAEIALNAKNAQDQIKLLERSLDEVRERARASQEDAAQARQAAGVARDRLAKLGSEFRDFRSDEVASKSNTVTRLISDAKSKLSDAKNALQVSAKATEASAAAGLGSAMSRRASGHAEAAAIFRTLDDVGIPGGFGSDAETARTDRDDALAQAQDAFGQAANALRSMRVTGDAKDRLNQAADRFDALAGIEPEPDFSEMSGDQASEENYDENADENWDDAEAEEETTEDAPEEDDG